MESTIALIGFGEAGSTFAKAAQWRGRARGYDVLDARLAAMPDCGVQPCRGMVEALSGAELVFSLVTADQALGVAQACATLLEPDSLFCDLNSVAPETKRMGERAVAAGSGRYVDVAVMAPVDPARMAVPLLVSGPDSAEASSVLQAAGFTNVRPIGDQVGRASAIKLLRSVMVKGVEALTAEMVLAAAAEGVVDEVLASLDASERAMGWHERADYNLDRMLEHGHRRAAEMREAARMLRTLGITAPMLTDNTISWQQALGDLGLSSPPQGLDAKLAAIAAAEALRAEP